MRLPGVIGLGARPFKPRVDFDALAFTKLIERGPRFIWERSLLCPCKPLAAETTQADPNCTRCRGIGFLWFGPPSYVLNDHLPTIGELDATQKAAQARNNGVIIRGYLSDAEAKHDAYDTLSSWERGTTLITVRPENQIAFYDRLVGIDAEVIYTEIITMPTTGLRLVPRYPAIDVTYIETSAGAKLTQGGQFELDKGDIVFFSGLAPAAATRLSLHYVCHPAWLVMEHPHVVRVTTHLLRELKPPSPAGAVQQLPIRAEVKLEFESEHLLQSGRVVTP